MLEEFLGARGVLQDVQELAQPAVLGALGPGPALLVDPVGGDAAIGDLVHLGGTNLNLDAMALRPDHAGVNGAVAVWLRRRDVVLEPARHHRIVAVDDAERLIALGHRGDDDAKRHDVGELLETDMVPLHLAPHRIGRLFAARNFGLQPPFGLDPLQLVDDTDDQILAAGAQETKPRQDRFAGIRVEFREGQVLELVLHVVHADTLSQRSVDLHSFAGDEFALFWILDMAQRAHVVQPVGELHQQHANILGHRQHQLAEVLRLLGLVGLEFDA